MFKHIFHVIILLCVSVSATHSLVLPGEEELRERIDFNNWPGLHAPVKCPISIDAIIGQHVVNDYDETINIHSAFYSIENIGSVSISNRSSSERAKESMFSILNGATNMNYINSIYEVDTQYGDVCIVRDERKTVYFVRNNYNVTIRTNNATLTNILVSAIDQEIMNADVYNESVPSPTITEVMSVDIPADLFTFEWGHNTTVSFDVQNLDNLYSRHLSMEAGDTLLKMPSYIENNTFVSRYYDVDHTVLDSVVYNVWILNTYGEVSRQRFVARRQ